MRRFGKRILSRLCERLPVNTSPPRPRRMMKTLLCWNREKWPCATFWLVERESQHVPVRIIEICWHLDQLLLHVAFSCCFMNRW
jgi:hypothetical protein